MEFKQVEIDNGGQMFFSGLEEARFTNYPEWRRGVEEMLTELQPVLMSSDCSLGWETYYARRADEMDQNYLASSEPEILLDQIKELLRRAPTEYTSFSLHFGKAMSSNHQMWTFTWSGIETDEEGRPLEPDLARHFDEGWDSDQPQPGGSVTRAASQSPEKRKQAALDTWFGGSEDNAKNFYNNLGDDALKL